MARRTHFFKVEAVPYWALVVFLILTFLTGGGSRADIQSLIILRPAAVIFCGVGLWSLKWAHVKANRFFFGMTAAIFALVIGHLIPLPPSIWGSLPGRELISEIDKAAELGEVWRPVSMVPSATWNAFYSLFVPLAVLSLGVQLSREERFKLLPIVIGLGLISGLVGLLQVIGDPSGPLYLYMVTNNGSAAGLFANRNHQAILLAMLFPMLAVYAAQVFGSRGPPKIQLWSAIAAGSFLVPLILVTGSRAGVIIAFVGLISTRWLYQKRRVPVPKKRKSRHRDLRWVAGLGLVVLLGGATIIASRAEALQRLFATNQMTDERLKFWGPLVNMAWKYFPVGSGAGSFVAVNQIDEPFGILTQAYTNQAHNEFLEVYLTLGLPGLILLVITATVLMKMAAHAFAQMSDQGRDLIFARLGLFLVLMHALASLADYPLRTPVHASLFAMGLLWMSAVFRSHLEETGRRTEKGSSSAESELVADVHSEKGMR